MTRTTLLLASLVILVMHLACQGPPCHVDHSAGASALARSHTPPEPLVQFISPEDQESTAAVEKALQTKLAKIEFNNTEIQTVLRFIQDTAHINIVPSWGVLQAAGIEKATLINVHLADVTVQKALRTILSNLGGATALEYIIESGAVTISTRDDLDQKTVVHIYNVRPILDVLMDRAMRVERGCYPYRSCTIIPPAEIASRGLLEDPYHPMAMPSSEPPEVVSQGTLEDAQRVLMDTIRAAVEPDSWKPEGTVGSITARNYTLVIRHTHRAHDEIAHLLPQLTAPWATTLWQRLRQPLKHVGMENVPYLKAVAKMQEMTGVNIVLSPDAAAKKLPNVTLDVDGLRIEQVLNLLARMGGLTWRMADNGVYMTLPPEPAKQGS